VSLLVLPDAALGRYIDDLRNPDRSALPPALALDDPHLRKVAELAGDMVVCLGFCEADGDRRYNSAVCVTGDGILGHHRKVHQPAGESAAYTAGDRFAAFDTPAGRLGMLIDYDKTFPESARTLALDGAEILACLSAWPTSITNRAPKMAQDRQSRRSFVPPRAGACSRTRWSWSPPTRPARTAGFGSSARRKSSVPAATSSPGPALRPASPSPPSTSRPRSRSPAAS
jgi:predicted amidohydrolase